MTAGAGRLSGRIGGPSGAVGGATITISDGQETLATSSTSAGTVGNWSIDGLSTPGTFLVSASKDGLSLESGAGHPRRRRIRDGEPEPAGRRRLAGRRGGRAGQPGHHAGRRRGHRHGHRRHHHPHRDHGDQRTGRALHAARAAGARQLHGDHHRRGIPAADPADHPGRRPISCGGQRDPATVHRNRAGHGGRLRRRRSGRRRPGAHRAGRHLQDDEPVRPARLVQLQRRDAGHLRAQRRAVRPGHQLRDGGGQGRRHAAGDVEAGQHPRRRAAGHLARARPGHRRPQRWPAQLRPGRRLRPQPAGQPRQPGAVQGQRRGGRVPAGRRRRLRDAGQQQSDGGLRRRSEPGVHRSLDRPAAGHRAAAGPAPPGDQRTRVRAGHRGRAGSTRCHRRGGTAGALPGGHRGRHHQRRGGQPQHRPGSDRARRPGRAGAGRPGLRRTRWTTAPA